MLPCCSRSLCYKSMHSSTHTVVAHLKCAITDSNVVLSVSWIERIGDHRLQGMSLKVHIKFYPVQTYWNRRVVTFILPWLCFQIFQNQMVHSPVDGAWWGKFVVGLPYMNGVIVQDTFYLFDDGDDYFMSQIFIIIIMLCILLLTEWNIWTLKM